MTGERGRISPNDLHRFSEECRRLFENGNQWTLMQTIALFAEYGEQLPEWAASAFVAGFEKVRNAEARSWDDVFGKPYPKGIHLRAERKRRKLLSDVYNRVEEIKKLNPRTAIGAELFERVGKEFNIGKTLAEEYYYEASNIWKSINPPEKRPQPKSRK